MTLPDSRIGVAFKICHDGLYMNHRSKKGRDRSDTRGESEGLKGNELGMGIAGANLGVRRQAEVFSLNF